MTATNDDRGSCANCPAGVRARALLPTLHARPFSSCAARAYAGSYVASPPKVRGA